MLRALATSLLLTLLGCGPDGPSLSDLCSSPEDHDGDHVDLNVTVKAANDCTDIGCTCCNICDSTYYVECADPQNRVILRAAPDVDFTLVSIGPKYQTRLGCLWNECDTPQCTPKPASQIHGVAGTFRLTMPSGEQHVIEVDKVH